MTKTALLVIYNHRYDKNIPRIEEMYRGRFTHVFHIVPFYDGGLPNVLPVYESSFRFQGYVSQACTHLRGKGFTHFFVVADDMLLNPRLTEENYLQEIGLGTGDCYIDSLQPLQELDTPWRTPEAMAWRLRQKGVEVEHILPPREEAEACFARHGLPTSAIPVRPFLTDPHPKFLLRYLRNLRRRRLSYPLVSGYSDLLILPAGVMDRFCLYCGVFAATGLFVELAIPTALVLASERILTAADTRLGGTPMWPDHKTKIHPADALHAAHRGSLAGLMEAFPRKALFLHPIKLSKWK